MKILVITDSINTNDSSGAKANVALIQNLNKAGFQLKVYHFTRKEITLEDIPCVAVKERKITHWYVLSKLQLLIKKITGININKPVEKNLGFSFTHFNDTHSFKKALQKESGFEPDWVLTLSKAGSFRPHKALLGIPEWHNKWLAYIHDPYPMHFYPRPYTWVEPGYYQKQEFLREVSKKSAHAVFPSWLLKEWMGSYYPDFLVRCIVIPHQITTHDKQANILLPDFFQSEKFTLVHAGSLMKQRNPKGLVEGYALFLKNNPEAAQQSQLLFLGSNTFHKKYLTDKSKIMTSLYVEPTYMDFETVQKIQQKACVNVILEAKAEISPFLPGKFPHCVAAGKPILHLGPALSETKRLLGEAYPFSAEIDDVPGIAELIKLLYENWKVKNEFQGYDSKKLHWYLGVEYLQETITKLS